MSGRLLLLVFVSLSLSALSASAKEDRKAVKRPPTRGIAGKPSINYVPGQGQLMLQTTKSSKPDFLNKPERKPTSIHLEKAKTQVIGPDQRQGVFKD